MIIAIDGPSGAGKSTVSKLVALETGCICMDTGAMYRCIAWQALQDGVALDDADALGAIAREKEINFVMEPGNPQAKAVIMGGVDVTRAIRTADIDRSVSQVSAHPSVRAALLEQQRRIGRSGNYVVDGRDVGTVIFPDAEVKFFLTASAEERARRRVAQNLERGVGSTDYEEVLEDIRIRDEKDSTRETAPLKAADDAILLDSSNYTIEEVAAIIVEQAHKVMGA